MSTKINQSNKNYSSFTFIDLFAGIGGFRLALEDFGGTCVFSSEWDKNSQETYAANFGEVPHGDITKINEQEIPPHDVLCAGFPCQAFSISGKRLGFNDTRGTLFRDIARIAKHHQPKVLFLENVKNLLKHNEGITISVIENTIKEIGYTPFMQVLKSSDYNLPQARERVYIIAFRNDLNIKNFTFPASTGKHKTIKEILEQEESVDPACYINRKDINIYGIKKKVADPKSPLQIGRINKGGQGERIYSIHASGITLSAYGGGAASKTGAYFVNGKVRKLTPRECARLQGFPEEFIIHPNRNIAYKQFGDSVSVPVLKAIFTNVIKTYSDLISKERIHFKRNIIFPDQQLNLEILNA